MPNILANAALILYPLLAPFAFVALRAPVAVALVFLLAELVLPANHQIDLPLLPPLDKASAACFGALLGVLVFARSRLRGTRPFRGAEAFLLVVLASALLTTLTNADRLFYGSLVIRGETPYEFVSSAIRTMIGMWVPFYLGRALLRSNDDHVAFWRLYVAAALIYTLPVLIELRMSPQFSNWIYGYTPSSWMQVLRAGGYRPMVFFNHGLSLAFFLLLAVLMGLALARMRRSVMALPAWPVFGFLLLVLLLCKSAGAALYAVCGGILLLALSPRRVVQLCGVASVLVLLYPLLRMGDLLPLQEAVDLAADQLGPMRAESLAFRFNNESRLLEHARERLMFGWGGYGRNFVYNVETGTADAVVDGYVIAILGSRGLLGYAGVFLLFLAPLWALVRRFRLLEDRRDRIFFAHVALVITIFAADLIINSTVRPYLLLLLGGVDATARGWRNTPAHGSSDEQPG